MLHRFPDLKILIAAAASALGAAACSADRLPAPAEHLVSSATTAFAVGDFAPRQLLVVDVPATLAGDDTMLTVAAPADTEHVVLRPYPDPCSDTAGCALIAFMWSDGGSWVFFPNAGLTTRWDAAVRGGPDERRGVLYVPAASAPALRDSVAAYTMYATTAQVIGHAGHLHATLYTTDAFLPGESPSDQPVSRGDGVLHVHAGDVVHVIGQNGEVSVTVQSPPPEPAASNESDGSLRTNATSYALQVTPNAITVNIPATYTNRTGHTLYRGFCQPLVPEKWVDGAWRPAYSIACALVGGLPRDSILPGATRVDTIGISSWRLPRTYPRFAFDPVPGTYRIDYMLIDKTTGKLLPEAARVSNAVQLELR